MDIKILKEIADLATTLDAETDSLNTEITNIEGALRSVKATVWIDVALGKNVDSNTAWELGYCKNKDDWRIVVRKFEIGNSLRLYAEIPLVNMPRAIRCQAVSHLDTLLVAIRDKMQTITDDVKQAKATILDLK